MADDPRYTEKTNEQLADLPEELEAEKKADELPQGERAVEWSVAKVCALIVAAVVVVLICAAIFA